MKGDDERGIIIVLTVLFIVAVLLFPRWTKWIDNLPVCRDTLDPVQRQIMSEAEVAPGW